MGLNIEKEATPFAYYEYLQLVLISIESNLQDKHYLL